MIAIDHFLEQLTQTAEQLGSEEKCFLPLLSSKTGKANDVSCFDREVFIQKRRSENLRDKRFERREIRYLRSAPEVRVLFTGRRKISKIDMCSNLCDESPDRSQCKK